MQMNSPLGGPWREGGLSDPDSPITLWDHLSGLKMLGQSQGPNPEVGILS